jgi:hypothetical protein
MDLMNRQYFIPLFHGLIKNFRAREHFVLTSWRIRKKRSLELPLAHARHHLVGYLGLSASFVYILSIT